MPLSEEELRLLEQMERALVEEDPKFAHTLRGTAFGRAARRRAIFAGVIFVVGVGLLMAGVMTNPVVGIVGFVVMLASATIGVTALRSPQPAEPSPFPETPQGFTVIQGGRGRSGRTGRPGRTGRGSRAPRSSHSFMERMEERWRRRRDSGGY